MITPQQAIERLISNNELFYDEMTDLMRQIMSGQVPPEQIAAIMTGLRIKVETVSEITASSLCAGITKAKGRIRLRFSPTIKSSSENCSGIK